MKISQKQIEQAMKKMGIQSEEIEAEEVVIRTREKVITISHPQVTKVNMGGQDTYQITGEASERPAQRFSVEDVRMVAQQSGASEEEAREALEETEDIAEAILKLKKSDA